MPAPVPPIGLAIALGTTLAYLTGTQIMKAIGGKELIDPMLAAWSMNIVFLVIAVDPARPGEIVDRRERETRDAEPRTMNDAGRSAPSEIAFVPASSHPMERDVGHVDRERDDSLTASQRQRVVRRSDRQRSAASGRPRFAASVGASQLKRRRVNADQISRSLRSSTSMSALSHNLQIQYTGIPARMIPNVTRIVLRIGDDRVDHHADRRQQEERRRDRIAEGAVGSRQVGALACAG